MLKFIILKKRLVHLVIFGSLMAAFSCSKDKVNPVVVKTFTFKVSVSAYDNTSKNFISTTSSISVVANDTVQFSKDLPDSASTIKVKDGYANYTITVTKSGFNTYTKTFAIDDLKTYSGGTFLPINLIATSLSSGLVGEYLFNGNTLDTSGKNHHGTNAGAVLTSDRRGTANSAYLFNGANSTHISIANNTDMNFAAGQDFTISLWTVIDANQPLDGGINDIFRKWSGDAQGYPFSISYANSASTSNQGKLVYVRYDGSGCANAPTSYSPVVSTGTFHHIVYIKSGNKLNQYVDNVLINQVTDNTSCTTTNNSDITIGCRGQLVRFFTGKVDDIRIFNRPLSVSEIDVLFKE